MANKGRAASTPSFLSFIFFYLILHGDSIAVLAVENMTRWKCWPVPQYPVHSADIRRELKAPTISDCLPLCVPLPFSHICWYHIILPVLSQALTLQPSPSASWLWPPRRSCPPFTCREVRTALYSFRICSTYWWSWLIGRWWFIVDFKLLLLHYHWSDREGLNELINYFSWIPHPEGGQHDHTAASHSSDSSRPWFSLTRL